VKQLNGLFVDRVSAPVRGGGPDRASTGTAWSKMPKPGIDDTGLGHR
jgi:hypothetical protein